jgi:hypothetical protein
MSNLFVVSTPLQLLTAYIIATNLFENDDNMLVYIQCNHEKIYQESLCVRKMFDDKSTWQVLRREKWLQGITRLSEFKEKLTQMKQTLFKNRLKFDKVFLGEDKSFENQLLVELSDNDHYYRMEDGVWSYHAPDRRWVSKLWHGVKMDALRHFAGLHSDMLYNAGGIGCGKAALADYLYKPHLLERVSPYAILIERDQVTNTMEKLTGKMQLYHDQPTSQIILFLGSKLVDQGKISVNTEIEILKHIYDICKQQGLTFLYKPHPAEKNDKLEFYQKVLPQMEFCQTREPMEILYYCLRNLKCVLAHSSSGLLFADVFSRDIIYTISLFKLYGNEYNDPILYRLMRNAGVVIPNTFPELRNSLCS